MSAIAPKDPEAGRKKHRQVLPVINAINNQRSLDTQHQFHYYYCIIMYSDLFDQLGGGRARAAAEASSSTRVATGPPPLVSVKAGKMTLTTRDDGSFDCEPDTTRGEIRLVYADSMLQWQWYNRREQSVVDKTLIPPQGPPAGTFERVPLEGKKHAKDRVYVWTHYPDEAEPKVQYDMYWMQDESEEKEDETVAKINQYLADPSSAVPEDEAAANATASAQAAAASSSSSSANNQEQVDALSNILENLGMPQQPGSAGASGSTDAPPAGTGTLTLADLQGAMAGMQQQQQASKQVPLNEIVTPSAIEKLLANDEVCDRLLPLLPETQRTKEALADNLKSPQVQQTLRSLTQALLPDDTGNMDGFASVLANFQLPEADMTTAMSNPIQAFLDAILKSVKDGGDDKMEEDAPEGESKDEGSA